MRAGTSSRARAPTRRVPERRDDPGDRAAERRILRHPVDGEGRVEDRGCDHDRAGARAGAAATARARRVWPPTSKSGFAAPSTRDARPPASRIAPKVGAAVTIRGPESSGEPRRGRRLVGPGPRPRTAAFLGGDADVLDRGGLVEALHHVDDREGGDRDGGEGLHLDAGAVGGAHGRLDLDARRRRSSRSTTAPCTPMTCASGSRSGVRLAAWMPAIRATASTSPFGTVPSRSAATTSAEQRTNPRAVAARTVGCLAVTSTMRAWPASSRCVKLMRSA